MLRDVAALVVGMLLVITILVVLSTTFPVLVSTNWGPFVLLGTFIAEMYGLIYYFSNFYPWPIKKVWNYIKEKLPSKITKN